MHIAAYVCMTTCLLARWRMVCGSRPSRTEVVVVCDVLECSSRPNRTEVVVLCDVLECSSRPSRTEVVVVCDILVKVVDVVVGLVEQR